MNLNFEKTRSLMVENQLRPNKIKEQNILNLFKITPKEDFVPQDIRFICYSDQNLKITNSRGYLKNLHLAQIIKFAEINNTDNVLHIGGLTGYLSLIIAKLCNKIFIIENDNYCLKILSNNLIKSNISNFEILKKNLDDGNIDNSPYDLIIIDSPIHNLNYKLISQLKNNGKLIYIIKLNDDLSKAYRIIKNNDNHTNEYLFDVFTNFQIKNFEKKFNF
tara:strand:+ start:145 stop:801 length:657 start_codon:yes stop_codon:yes gene_type:complete